MFRDGKVLFGKIMLSPDALALKQYLLVSYDLSGKKNSLQVKIAKMVYGYTSKKTIKGKKKEYVYKGLKDLPGAKLISKSAIVLPLDKGSEFVNELKEMGAKIKVFAVWF